MVMESSELPATRFPVLAGAVKVFMLDHWQGQCQNHFSIGHVPIFIIWILVLAGLSYKSIVNNYLGQGETELREGNGSGVRKSNLKYAD
jgi:hypothetical protein